MKIPTTQSSPTASNGLGEEEHQPLSGRTVITLTDSHEPPPVTNLTVEYLENRLASNPPDPHSLPITPRSRAPSIPLAITIPTSTSPVPVPQSTTAETASGECVEIPLDVPSTPTHDKDKEQPIFEFESVVPMIGSTDEVEVQPLQASSSKPSNDAQLLASPSFSKLRNSPSAIRKSNEELEKLQGVVQVAHDIRGMLGGLFDELLDELHSTSHAIEEQASASVSLSDSEITSEQEPELITPFETLQNLVGKVKDVRQELKKLSKSIKAVRPKDFQSEKEKKNKLRNVAKAIVPSRSQALARRSSSRSVRDHHSPPDHGEEPCHILPATPATLPHHGTGGRGSYMQQSSKWDGTSSQDQSIRPSNLKKVTHLWCINTKIATQLDLDDSIKKIINGVCDILNCERSALFIIDRERGELISKCTSNQVEIRFPSDQGIAGYVATTGLTLNIPDAYKDKRFNPEIDRNTGFITRSILCMAIKNPANQPLAVIEAINKRDEGFNQEDLAMLGILGTQIGIVLNNAQKFEQAMDTQKQIKTFLNAAQALTSKLQLDALCEEIVAQAKKVSGADSCSLLLVDNGEQDREFLFYPGNGTKERRSFESEEIGSYIFNTGELVKIEPHEFHVSPLSRSPSPTVLGATPSASPSSGRTTPTHPFPYVPGSDKKICVPISDTTQKIIAILQLTYHTASCSSNMLEFIRSFAAQAAVALENSLLFEKTAKWQSEMQNVLSNFKGAILTIGPEGNLINSNRPARVFCIDEDLMRNTPYTRWLQPTSANEAENNTKLIEDIGRVLRTRDPVYCSRYLFYHPRDPMHRMYVDYNIFPMLDANEKTSVVLGFKETSPVPPVVGSLAEQASAAWDNRRRSSFPMDRSALLLQQQDSKRSRSLEKVTILFSDIRGFTTMTESMALEEIVDMLNAYFTEMVEAVFEEHGTLDKYIGDGMLCVFGLTPSGAEERASAQASSSGDDASSSPSRPSSSHSSDSGLATPNSDSVNACNAALNMRGRLLRFNESRPLERKISIGVGISTGKVSVGSIGSKQHFEFTVIGDDVNLACRLEGCTKIYGVENMVLCSDSTYKEASTRFLFRPIDILCVKGKVRPIRVYELLGRTDDEVRRRIPGLTEQLPVFLEALTAFEGRAWGLARSKFEEVFSNCSDGVSRHYIDRCTHYISNPPPSDWDGVWRLPEK